MTDLEINLDGNDEKSNNTSSSVEATDNNLIRQVIEFCGGPDLIQVFGGTGSGKTEFCVSLAESALNQENKDVLFIDTERNLSNNERLDGSDYVYIPDFNDLYAYISGKKSRLSDNPFGQNTTNSNTLKGGYDVVILDSLGFPALMAYDEYSIEDDADQFTVFQMIQFMSGQMKKYAQMNNALIVTTNQPKSELSDSTGEVPFGDKSQFAFKELWLTEKSSSSEIKTTCKINAHRSRQAGEGKELFRLEISDSGTRVEAKYNEEVDEEVDEWTA
ncbi:MAG: hypothetical protein J07AB43_01690 [Candidatus Nanosalina sp. J07AB43]|jgi:RecA/RadA recombinase|nr:MAG: hypothetical protein J07AB43_01690 [Candidatus Nanosalina sp. J07AB43]